MKIFSAAKKSEKKTKKDMNMAMRKLYRKRDLLRDKVNRQCICGRVGSI
jgi:hypothetical protein